MNLKSIRENLFRQIDLLLVFLMTGSILLGPVSKRVSKVIYAASVSVIILQVILARQRRLSLYWVPSVHVGKAMAFFFVSLLCSVLFSLNINQSQSVFFERFIDYFVFFFIGCRLSRNMKYVRWLLQTAIFWSLIMSVGALRDYGMLRVDKLLTSFGYDLQINFFLLLYVPLVFSYLLFADALRKKIYAGFIFSLLVPVIYLNGSRATWIITGTVLTMLASLKNKKSLWIAVVILAMLPFFHSAYFQERIGTLFEQTPRVELLKTAVDIFKDFPVFGIGLGNFENYVAVYNPEVIRGLKYLHADNNMIELLAETGAVGLLAFFAFLWSVLKMAYCFFREHFGEMKGDTYIYTGLFFGCLSCILMAFTANVLTVGLQNPLIFWFLFGLCAGISSKEKNNVWICRSH